MGRTRYVHRTIVSTEVEVMTVNTDTKEFGNVLVPVQGTYSDITDSKLEKEVKKGFDSLTLADTVMVKITDIHPVTKMYKMLESQFMALAESEVVEGEVFNDGDEGKKLLTPLKMNCKDYYNWSCYKLNKKRR